MFWSARDVGLFTVSPTFEDWYVRFIAHFMNVYDYEAVQFARESLRWSSDVRNIETYLSSSPRCMDEITVMGMGPDHIGIPLKVAQEQLPPYERDNASGNSFPYNRSHLPLYIH